MRSRLAARRADRALSTRSDKTRATANCSIPMSKPKPEPTINAAGFVLHAGYLIHQVLQSKSNGDAIGEQITSGARKVRVELDANVIRLFLIDPNQPQSPGDCLDVLNFGRDGIASSALQRAIDAAPKLKIAH